MPAEQPVQHVYIIRTGSGMQTSRMAVSPEAAVAARRSAIINELVRRAAALTITAEHAEAICPACGGTSAAVSDLYPEADP
jgi:hypothetical protein